MGQHTPGVRREFEQKFVLSGGQRDGRAIDDLTKGELSEIEAEAQERVDTASRAEVLTRIGKLRQLVGEWKAPVAVEMAKAYKEEGEPVIFWAHHGPVIHALRRAMERDGLRTMVIDGSTSGPERADIAEWFQAGKVDALICSTAAKEGLTLTRAKTAVFVERYWTPADEAQAEDRIHRIGQTRQVEIIRMNVDESIDDYMDTINNQKQSIVDQVLGDEDIERKFADDIAREAVLTFAQQIAARRKPKENPRVYMWDELL